MLSTGPAAALKETGKTKGRCVRMRKVLIANRGEIACRVIKSCHSLGLRSVAVYSAADTNALHTQLADEACLIGEAPPAESYLNIERVVAAARESGADAVHPGYGFLAENARFAEKVLQEGLVWIGPRPQTIEDMGDKERARLLAGAAGLPILPGSPRYTPGNLSGIEEAARDVQFPLLVKASGGGGGIGMRLVTSPDKLIETVENTQRTAQQAFGDGTVYLERFIPKARHLEVQVFGFGDGHAVHLYERECSIQRRFQKIIEESPAPGLTPPSRDAMCTAALALATRERYQSAGTVEFVVDGTTGAFYFLEMNTRIQVEHPVTELNTGCDLVAMQLQLAAGTMTESARPNGFSTAGHSIECRIYAEQPEKMFLPSPGRIDELYFPREGDGVRIDTGIREGDEITYHYDPMVAKVICHGKDRKSAIEKTRASLEAIKISPLRTNLDFLRRTLAHPEFSAGNLHTGFIEAHKKDLLAR